jgi:SAM-dependent methyltransferase
MTINKKIKNRLLKIWESDEYLHELKGTLVEQEALLDITPFIKNKQIAVEVGSGDGTKLNRICKYAGNSIGIGVDLSTRSLRHAKSVFEWIFIKADGEFLPFRNSVADVTLTMYTLEHLTNPEAIIEEMIRITKKGGYLIFLAPNYGSPFFPSPCNRKGLLTRIVWAVALFLSSSNELNWTFVSPRINEQWKSDFDTVVEPFLPSLKRCLAKREVEIIVSKSIWPQGTHGKSLLLKVLRGFWGPQLFVIGKKQTN